MDPTGHAIESVPAAPGLPPVWKGWLVRLGSVLWIGVCVWALYGLHKEWSRFHLHDLREALSKIGPRHLLLAGAFTAVSYACNASLGLLGHRWIGFPLKKPLADLIEAFISSAFSMNAGGTLLGGGSVRMRFAKLHGMSATDVGKLTAFSGLAGWAGHAGLCGVLFLTYPPPFSWLSPGLAVALGVSALTFCLAMTLAGKIWPGLLPPVRLALPAVLVSFVDWGCAGLAMWSLFPGLVTPEIWSLVAIVVIAQAVAAFTHVPGGIGVLEFTITKAVGPAIAAPVLAGALVTYRLIYYLLPFLAAVVLLGCRELGLRRDLISKGGAAALRGWSATAPRLASLLALGGGLMLLVSANTPIEAARRDWLEHVLPLPFVEGSHFLSSLTGALLIILARGLQRRVRTAWVLTVTAMIGGILFSLAKGLDWEEAVVLLFMLICLLPFKARFYRRSALWSYRFTPGWWMVLLSLLGFSVWVGFFATRHVDYQNDLWWRFTLQGDASRFLRGATGVICVFLVVAMAQVLRPAKSRDSEPVDLAKVEELVRHSDHSDAALAWLGDKKFMFSSDGGSGLMYADQGRSRIVMGDPLGRSAGEDDLLWRFVERSRDEGLRPVFYSVSVTEVPRFVDMGFKLFKLGEEARVDISHFSLDSADAKELRRSLNRFQKNGCTFTIWDPETVTKELPVLRKISDEWLAEHKAGEKGFSLGFFSDDYVRRFPCAVVRDANGRVVAFANLWQTEDKTELSIDLMRYLPSAPGGVMEAIFIELMLWGHSQGFKWFNLGMAPLSGLSSHPLAPFWHKIAGKIFMKGESFYNFQGLRDYKDKFNPDWQPRYIAVQDSWNLPNALLDVTLLVGGGVRSTFVKSK